MFGSCSEPIKANKIISCGTRDSQYPIRTVATKRRHILPSENRLTESHNTLSDLHLSCSPFSLSKWDGTSERQLNVSVQKWDLCFSRSASERYPANAAIWLDPGAGTVRQRLMLKHALVARCLFFLFSSLSWSAREYSVLLEELVILIRRWVNAC